MVYTFIVKNFNGELAVFLLRNGVSSRQLVKLRKKEGLILLNGKMTFSNVFVRDGDEIRIKIEDVNPENVPVSAGKIRTVFEDDHFCVIDKPAGLAVIATRKYYGDSLQNILAGKWGQNFIFHPVNRLDKDTSGLMVVAKNAFVHSLFDKMLRLGQIEKKYSAVAGGRMTGAGVIDLPILDVKGQMKRIVSKEGKRAVTEYKVIKNFDDATLLELKLITGRTHQIRLHLSAMGHPLVGDGLYGEKSESIARHALHAGKLSFIHPVTQETLEFASSLPDDMACLINIR